MADSTRKYGTGSLTIREGKRGQTWYGQWWSNGGKVSRAIGPVRKPGSKDGLTEKMAETELRRLMQTVERKADPRKAMTFAAADELYRKHLERAGRKRATLTAIESCFRVWVIPFWGSKPIAEVTYHDVERLISTMERKGLAPKSIHNYVGTMSGLFNYGLDPRRAWVTTNPCADVELPAVQASEEIRFLTVEEVDALIRAVPEGPYADLDRVLYRVAAMSGLRQGELIALRWMDVDWVASKIRVRQNYVLGEFVAPKSKRSTRSVPLANAAARALAAFQPLEAGDEDLVFADPLHDLPLSKRSILIRFRKALQRAGLDTTHRFHDLRHTFGTRVAASGTSIRVLQEWMGHRDMQTTLRYADYAPSEHEADMIDAAFRGADMAAHINRIEAPDAG